MEKKIFGNKRSVQRLFLRDRNDAVWFYFFYPSTNELAAVVVVLFKHASLTKQRSNVWLGLCSSLCYLVLISVGVGNPSGQPSLYSHTVHTDHFILLFFSFDEKKGDEKFQGYLLCSSTPSRLSSPSRFVNYFPDLDLFFFI